MSKGWKKKQKQNQVGKNPQQPSGHQQPERACLYTQAIQPSPEEKQHYADEKIRGNKQIGLSRWQNIITAVAAGVGLAGLWFVFRSTQEVARQSNTLDRQMRTDQRAWMRIKTHQPNQVFRFVDGVPTSKIEIANIGKTVARNVHCEIVVTLVENGKEPEFHYDVPKVTIITGAAFPMDPWETEVSAMTQTQSGGVIPLVISRAQSQSLASGDQFLVIYGKVDYEDIFRIKHWTRFCAYGYFLNPMTQTKTFNFESSVQYNSTDNN